MEIDTTRSFEYSYNRAFFLLLLLGTFFVCVHAVHQQDMDEDTYTATLNLSSQNISQPATELNQGNGIISADGSPSSTPGSYGGGIRLSSLNNAIITKSEFSLSNVNYGLSPPSTFILPDEFPVHQPANVDDIIPIQPHIIDNDGHSSPVENQRSYIFSNSYSDFTSLSGAPLTIQHIYSTNADSPPSSLPSSPPGASTPLRNSQQLYPGLSTTPLRTSLPPLRNSSPFPFTPIHLKSLSQSPMSASVFSDAVPRLSSPPKLSALMLVGGSPSQYPAPVPSRFILAQSCPLPTSSIPSTPSPLSQHSRAPPFTTQPFSKPFHESDAEPLSSVHTLPLPPQNPPIPDPSFAQELHPFPPSPPFQTQPNFSRKSPPYSLRKSAVLNANTASYLGADQRPNGDHEGEDEREGKDNNYLQASPLSASDPVPAPSLAASDVTVSEDSRISTFPPLLPPQLFHLIVQ
jgi:hypothetical protein